MIDLSAFSAPIRRNPIAANTAALERLELGIKRLLSVLETERVAGIRTLEMKISDGGPTNQRVEPHILGLSGVELIERGRVTIHKHPETAGHNWYAPARFKPADIEDKLKELVAIYKETVDPRFTAALGDPLEIAIYKCLLQMKAADRRIQFLGQFDLTTRGQSGRYPKVEPTVNYSGSAMAGPPDFTLFEPSSGEAAIIECKNVREWIYPSDEIIRLLIAKAIATDMTPVLIARRIPYITRQALLAPAGIIGHETYHQMYPETDYGRDLAGRVIKTRGLGYADVRATEEPTDRTTRFMTELLPSLLPTAAEKFRQNTELLNDWVNNKSSWTTVRTTLAGDYNEPDAGMLF